MQQTNSINMTLINALLLLALLLPTQLWAENQALLIGINQYAYVGPNLQGSENDVANMKKLAINYLGFKEGQMHTLHDKEATKQGILAAIKQHLITNTKPNDRILFYFSGHGYQVPDNPDDNNVDKEKDGLDETLVAYDVSYNQQTKRYSKMITDDELRILFDSIDDRQVTMILDSCHSGTITRGLGQRSATYLEKSLVHGYTSTQKSLSRSFEDVTDDPAFRQHKEEEPFISHTRNRIVWSAVMAAQKALIDFTAPQVQGVFTRWFIDGLVNKSADQDSNGKVSNAELLDYTREKSKDHCQQQRLRCKLGLTPTLQAPNEQFAASLIRYSGFSLPPAVPSTKPEPLAQPEVIAAEELPDSLLPEHNADMLKIRVESNGKTVKKTIKHGKSLFVSVSSKRNGHLVLLDKDAQGKIKQLYPNPSVTETFITANKAVFIPEDSTQFEIKATEVGKSQLIAIVIHDKLPNLGEVTRQAKDLLPVPRHEAYLGLLSQRIHQTWTGDVLNRAVNYSIGKFEYTVSR